MTVRLSRAERRSRTREDLIAAAERCFTRQGFHATSVDQIAQDAGYTKGAVYSNFAAKEDLFFAVYEVRADRTVREYEQALREDGLAGGLVRIGEQAAARRGRDDGWLAVFFEFWAHVVRHRELRERFAAIHARAQAPIVRALERHAAEHGIALPDDARRFVAAQGAMQVGLSLERLVRPDVVDADLGVRLARRALEELERGAAAPGGGGGRAP